MNKGSVVVLLLLSLLLLLCLCSGLVECRNDTVDNNGLLEFGNSNYTVYWPDSTVDLVMKPKNRLGQIVQNVNVSLTFVGLEIGDDFIPLNQTYQTSYENTSNYQNLNFTMSVKDYEITVSYYIYSHPETLTLPGQNYTFTTTDSSLKFSVSINKQVPLPQPVDIHLNLTVKFSGQLKDYTFYTDGYERFYHLNTSDLFIGFTVPDTSLMGNTIQHADAGVVDGGVTDHSITSYFDFSGFTQQFLYDPDLSLLLLNPDAPGEEDSTVISPGGDGGTTTTTTTTTGGVGDGNPHGTNNNNNGGVNRTGLIVGVVLGVFCCMCIVIIAIVVIGFIIMNHNRKSVRMIVF